MAEAPHGSTLEQFAEISAMVAEGDRPVDAVIATHGLTVPAWREICGHFTRLLAFDAAGEGSEARRYADLFAATQDRLRPVPEMSADEWAAVIKEVGAGDSSALTRRGLTHTDYQRLCRHWARAVAADRALAKRYNAALLASHRAR